MRGGSDLTLGLLNLTMVWIKLNMIFEGVVSNH